MPAKTRIRANRRIKNLAVKTVKGDNVTGGKLIAVATPKLYEAACKGTHLPEVVIEVWRADGQ